MKSNKNIKSASFLERLCAFIIDVFLVAIVASLLTQPFYHKENDNTEKMFNELQQANKDYMSNKINMKVYTNKVSDISYEISRESGLLSIIKLFITALYFIVFQFKNKGQTIGKKLMKIRVAKNNETELTMNDMMLRSLFINSIIFDLICICIVLFANKNYYLYSTYLVQLIQYILLFVIALMTLCRKDKRGIHDLLANTRVIKEVKEM